MRFKRILVYGINRISKKNLQLHQNIDKIFEYIENYRKKNGELSWGLWEIKTFFSTKTPDLIRIFVKSEDFENEKKKRSQLSSEMDCWKKKKKQMYLKKKEYFLYLVQ